ncbi:TetR/AcrR family transcriptional regulator [Sporichthya brevicatena]
MAKPVPKQMAEKLLAVTEQVVQPGGPVRINDVVDATGISRSTLYYYFESAEELTRFLLVDKLAAIGETVQKEVSAATGPTERLVAVLDATLRVTTEQPALASALLRANLAGENFGQQLRETKEVVFGALREIVQDGVREGTFIPVDVEDVMALIMGGVAMASLDELNRGGPDPAALRHTVRSVIARGLLADPTSFAL